MCSWKRTRLLHEEAMDHDKWKQHEVPENVLCHSSRIPKLKLSLKKVQQNSTPVSKLCESLTNSTLATPVKAAQHTVEPMHVETPVKPLQKPTALTPSTTCSNNPTITPLFTPECTSLEDIRAAITFSPLLTPKTTKSHSPIGTPLCVALGKPLKTKNVSSTPRRSSRKSVSELKSLKVPENEEIDSKVDNSLKCLEDRSTNLTLSDRSHKLTEIVIDPVNKVCEEDKNIDNTQLGESLCARSAGSANVPNPLDWLPYSLHKTVLSHNDITSEPRLFRKSDVGVVSARRLSFSAKKSSKQKNIIPEYDPDDDIFAQGLMPVQFNIDSLKNQIGQLLNHADIPSPQLRKSYSCGMLNNDVHVTQPVTPVSSRRKQSKRTPSAAPKATIKRTLSAPELQKPVGLITPAVPPPPTATLTATSKTTSSCPKVSSEGKIRALLRARDIIKNIRQRAKNFPSLPSEVVKQPKDTKCDKTKSEEVTSHVVSQTRGSSSGTSDLSKEATDTYDLLPPTQPFESFILGDVTAYVEVISKNEDISAGVRKELLKLGATVVPAFNRDVPVTHVVFNDGNISTYKKAKKRNIPLVSVLWIEACRKAGVKVHEGLFPPYQIERYESPALQKELKKRRIMRFYSDDKQRPSPRQRKRVVQNETPIQPSAETSDQNSSVRKSACAPKWVEEVAGVNGRVRMLVKMTGISKKEFKELVNRPPTPDSDIELDQNSPLPVRLLRKLAKNLPVSSNLDNLDETSKNIETNDIAASFNNKSSYENSFAKKLIEVEGIEEDMEISDKQNEEITKTLSISPVSVMNVTSQVEHSNMLNDTQRKKVSKRKLLSPVQESITVTNDNDEDDNDKAVVINPHSCTPRKLNGEKIGKKRKSDKTEIEKLDEPEINELDVDKAVVSREKECVTNAVDPIRRSRRSSSYFVKTKRGSPSPTLQKAAIVCTQLHTPDIDLVASVVEQLGVFVVEKNVTSYTSHIVAGAPKRTMKLLKGMVRGCWVVSHEWVLRSLEAGKWLDEEEFELITFSSSVQKYRLEKLSFGGIFKPDIFSSCGPIFVSSQATAPRGDLVELVVLCGGRIVSRISKAKVAVGKKYPDVICVTALWILDSIQYYCCKPFDDYQCT